MEPDLRNCARSLNGRSLGKARGEGVPASITLSQAIHGEWVMGLEAEQALEAGAGGARCGCGPAEEQPQVGVGGVGGDQGEQEAVGVCVGARVDELAGGAQGVLAKPKRA